MPVGDTGIFAFELAAPTQSFFFGFFPKNCKGNIFPVLFHSTNWCVFLYIICFVPPVVIFYQKETIRPSTALS